MNILSPASRLQEIRNARGLTQAALARLASIETSTLNKIDKGKRGITGNFSDALAQALEVPREALFAEIGSPIPDLEPQAAPVQARMVQVPELAVSGSFGNSRTPANMTDTLNKMVEMTWVIPRDLISSFVKNPADVRVMKIAGDSMEPDYQAGERVMVDTGHCLPNPPGIYALWDGVGVVFKRLEVVFGSANPVLLRIMSINPSYPTYELPLEEVTICGRVIGKWVWK